jgi:maltose alpha-D-glucosyltransferase/alpha-amylase
VDQRALHARRREPARRVQGERLRQGRLEVRARGLHRRQARDDQQRDLSTTLTRESLARAVLTLDPAELAARRWYAAKGEVPGPLRLAHAFTLAPGAALTLVDATLPGGAVQRYVVPFVAREGSMVEADEGDGAWRALGAAIATGRTIPAIGTSSSSEDAAAGPVDAALVCRPSPGLASVWGEEPERVATTTEARLRRDQSNTSVVLGGRLLLKAYRRIQPGLNPDLELTAFLSEEAAFPGVPRLAGWAEVVTRDAGAATVATLQAFIADAEDLYEATAERLADLVAAPGAVSLEWATEVASDLGTLVAGLHAALASPPADAPDLAPRAASHDELRGWRMEVHRWLNAALAALPAVDPAAAAELRDAASDIAARASRFEAVAAAPFVMRIHADLHLGQVLLAEDGYRVIDFEGEPLRPIDERRRLDSPLRDVASMLRSLDHVARSARRRAEARAGGSIAEPGLDVEAWIARARERFLVAYAAGLRDAGSPFPVDLDLLDAFEVAKETYELVDAAIVLPSWLWAPREGMRWLLARHAAV